jgi:hypothetical protein
MPLEVNIVLGHANSTIFLQIFKVYVDIDYRSEDTQYSC